MVSGSKGSLGRVGASLLGVAIMLFGMILLLSGEGTEGRPAICLLLVLGCAVIFYDLFRKRPSKLVDAPPRIGWFMVLMAVTASAMPIGLLIGSRWLYQLGALGVPLIAIGLLIAIILFPKKAKSTDPEITGTE